MNDTSFEKKKNTRFFLGGIVLFFLLVTGATVGVGIYRVYARAAVDPFSVGLARVLHLSAAKINGERILYSDYADDLKAIHTMRVYDQAHQGAGAALTEQQMSDQVLWRLVNTILLNQAAAGYGLQVEAKDLQEVRNQIMAKYKNPGEADAELKNRYGWDMATYETKVIRPFILQKKLNDHIESDTAARAEVRARAEEVLKKIKAGALFEEMAKMYGQDGTAASGGELPIFGTGDMEPQFEAAAFALKKGELSSTLIESPYGFHILRVDDITRIKTKDEKGKTVEKPQIKARHILFRYPGLDTYLDGLARHAEVHWYVPVHNPLDDFLKKKS